MKKLTKLMDKVILENKIRPILGAIVYRNGLFIGTNLEQTVYFDKNIGEGVFVTEYKSFKNAIDILKDVKSFEVIDGIITLKNGTKKIKLENLDLEEYPQILDKPYIADLKIYSLNFEDIKRLKGTMSRDTDNLAINGINISNNRISSTDTYQMLTLDSNIELNITIPEQAISLLFEDIRICANDKIYLYTDDYLIVSRNIDLSFPDVVSIMSQEFANNIELKKIEFENILKDSIKVSKNFEYKNAFMLEVKEDIFKIAAKNDKMQFEDNIKLSSESDYIKIILNNKFLNDYLKNCNAEKLNIQYNNSKSMIMINNEYVLMPLSLHDEFELI